MAWK
jgi:hypothetical protein